MIIVIGLICRVYFSSWMETSVYIGSDDWSWSDNKMTERHNIRISLYQFTKNDQNLLILINNVNW